MMKEYPHPLPPPALKILKTKQWLGKAPPKILKTLRIQAKCAFKGVKDISDLAKSESRLAWKGATAQPINCRSYAQHFW
jgi:hypothetical protein